MAVSTEWKCQFCVVVVSSTRITEIFCILATFWVLWPFYTHYSFFTIGFSFCVLVYWCETPFL